MLLDILPNTSVNILVNTLVNTLVDILVNILVNTLIDILVNTLIDILVNTLIDILVNILVDTLADTLVDITYFTIKLPNPSNCLKKLDSTNSYYISLISSLLNKEPVYIILILDLEDISISFLYI
jgi:hypothetical protein